MNKCPSCGAPLNALTKFCEACGNEITPKSSPTAESATAQPATPTAAELCGKIQEDLAVLASRPPASTFAAFLTGLFTPPSLGLVYLAVKAASVFGHTGKSPERSKLALEQNLRTAEMCCKSDPEVLGLIGKSRMELGSYDRRQHVARTRFLAGMATFVLLVILALIGVVVYQKQQAAKAVAAANALAEKQQHDAQVEAEKQRQAEIAAAEKQRQAEVEAAAAAAELARINHDKAVSVTAAFTTNTPFKAAVIVENHSNRDLNDKALVLHELLSSLIAGKKFSVLSPEAMAPVLNGYAPAGAQPPPADAQGNRVEPLLANNATALPLAQNLGVDIILYASITSFGSETKKWTGSGVATENQIYTLRVAYRLVEAGEGGAIRGAEVVATKTIRQTEGLQTITDEFMNELLADAARQVAEVVSQPHRQAAGDALRQ
jgi:hypothetical protein